MMDLPDDQGMMDLPDDQGMMDLPDDPVTGIREGVVALDQMRRELEAGGFTREEAFRMVMSVFVQAAAVPPRES